MRRANKPLIALLLCAAAPLALPQDTATPQPAGQTPQGEQAKPQAAHYQAKSPGLTVRELFVIQADRYDSTANNPKHLTTTLFKPIKHTGRSKRLDQTGKGYQFTPMPLGLITFSGKMAEPIQIKLSLYSGSGRVHAHWPSNGITGKRSIDWPDISAADEQDRVMPIAQKNDWLAPLRAGDDRLWFQSRKGQFKERFLLYDASFFYKPAIRLDVTNNQYRLKTEAPERSAPPMTVLMRKTESGWSANALAAPWPTNAPTIARKGIDSVEPSPQKALTPIKNLLKQRGYNAEEIELALGMIASSGFDKSRFLLVYVLPAGGIDEHIKLKVVPKPNRVIRTAIVVVKNVDPELGSRVNALLDDLGADQWLKREHAQRELAGMGQVAIKKLQQLLKHQDPEVAFRAQQILDEYDWKHNAGD